MMEDKASFEVTSPTRGIILFVETDLEAFSRTSFRRPTMYTFLAPFNAKALAIIKPIPE
jgi:hypothetical protein